MHQLLRVIVTNKTIASHYTGKGARILVFFVLNNNINAIMRIFHNFVLQP